MVDEAHVTQSMQYFDVLLQRAQGVARAQVEAGSGGTPDYSNVIIDADGTRLGPPPTLDVPPGTTADPDTVRQHMQRLRDYRETVAELEHTPLLAEVMPIERDRQTFIQTSLAGLGNSPSADAVATATTASDRDYDQAIANLRNEAEEGVRNDVVNESRRQELRQQAMSQIFSNPLAAVVTFVRSMFVAEETVGMQSITQGIQSRLADGNVNPLEEGQTAADLAHRGLGLQSALMGAGVNPNDPASVAAISSILAPRSPAAPTTSAAASGVGTSPIVVVPPVNAPTPPGQNAGMSFS